MLPSGAAFSNVYAARIFSGIRCHVRWLKAVPHSRRLPICCDIAASTRSMPRWMFHRFGELQFLDRAAARELPRIVNVMDRRLPRISPSGGLCVKVEGEQLRRFARFAERIGYQGPLTTRLAGRWASSWVGGRQLTAARRIEVLRPFAAYCRQFDPSTEIPPRWLFGPAHRRLVPHIFGENEIIDLWRPAVVFAQQATSVAQPARLSLG
ncbi:hypothetical protein OKW50_008238 [Paraburkholderia youngii]